MSSLPIPDTRFAPSFYRKLKKQANLNDKSVDGPITARVVAKVIWRDIIMMPFIQGFFMNGVLILLRPYLRKMIQSGRTFSNFLFNRKNRIE